ncbi:PP2C family serine/threonine-protein phosphatase [Promineifilum sp.]|uniref:PP2C family protein-serine/threonine phosphatase n=1 Tax=Promineifilum sp. TaxID=2664178 RepID=UPI0035B37425
MNGAVEIWGETVGGRGHPDNREAIFFPRPGEDVLDGDVAARRGYLLAVVAGNAGGATGPAARRAGQALLSALIPAYYSHGGADTAERLRQAVLEAAHTARERLAQPAADATLLAALIDRHQLYLAQAGGGRAYRLRGETAERLTRDVAPGTSGLLRDPDARPDFSLMIPLQDGDRLLLCSDGLAGALDDETLGKVGGRDRPSEAVARLIALAQERGAPDDLSIIVAQLRVGAVMTRAHRAVLIALGGIAAILSSWFFWELVRYWRDAG